MDASLLLAVAQQQRQGVPVSLGTLVARDTGRESTVLTWADVGDGGTVKYRVYQDDVLILETADTSQLTLGLGGLSASTSYDFEIRSVNAADNESAGPTTTITTSAASTLVYQEINGNLIAASPTALVINNGTIAVSHTGGRSSDPIKPASSNRAQILAGGTWPALVMSYTFDTDVEDVVFELNAFTTNEERLTSINPAAISVERTTPNPSLPATPTIENGGTEMHGADGNIAQGTGQNIDLRFGDIAAGTTLTMTYDVHGSIETANATAFIRKIRLKS